MAYGRSKRITFFLALLTVSFLFPPTNSLQLANAQETDQQNVILIGWDGVQRNHLFELLNQSRLPNLASFINQGKMVNITVSDHGTDTKAGWTQILTGYRWWRTGVFNNVYWFHSIPAGYTTLERAENYFGQGQIATAFIVGKLAHMEIIDGTGDTVNGRYTRQAIYRNLPSVVDVCTNGDKGANIVGPSMLSFLENNANRRFFAFFHFSDPDSAGHNPAGGENSLLYENAIIRCDNWLGQILDKLNALNLAQKTLVYVTADHGFDEGGFAHNYAPFITLATNDNNVIRNGDEVDVAPTIYYALGMWDKTTFSPTLDGFPLQLSLPDTVAQQRQNALDDVTKPPKATISSPTDGSTVSGTVNIGFNTSDAYLNAALLLIDNTLRADGPWTWQTSDKVEAIGTYAWDIAGINSGSHNITILSFDEHGAYTGPSTSTITVSKPIPQPTQTYTPTTLTTKPAATPHPTASPQSTASPTPTPSTPPNTPTTNPETTNSDLPSGYIYAATIAAIVIAIVMVSTVYLVLKRKNKIHSIN